MLWDIKPRMVQLALGGPEPRIERRIPAGEVRRIRRVAHGERASVLIELVSGEAVDFMRPQSPGQAAVTATYMAEVVGAEFVDG